LNKLAIISSTLFFTNLAVASDFRVSMDVDYLSGDYGTNDTTEMTVVTAKARYKQDKWTMQATLPYMHVKGPSVVDGISLGGAGKTEHGLGDLKLSLAYLTYYSPESGYGFSTKAKIKLPTADEDKGLGTGETDYYLQIDPFVVIDKTTIFSTVGHKFYGDTSTTDYNNVWYVTLGASYKIDENLSFGLGGKFREKSTDTSEDKRSMFLFAQNKLTDQDSIDFNASKGFTDSTQDWGIGLSYKHSY